MSFPDIEDLLNDEGENSQLDMNDLFKEAFESFEKCKQKLDKLRPGADISTRTPAAETVILEHWWLRERRAVRLGFLGG